MFHADIDGQSSLALDAIEAARPHVDYGLLTYLTSSAFANRDFTELPDGEVRLSHPLSSHLAHTAAFWRKVCEPVANWLTQSFGRAAGARAMLTDDRKIVVQSVPRKQLEPDRELDPLAAPPALSGPVARIAAICAQGQPSLPSVLGMRKGVGRQRAHVLFERVC
jgi:hypothetical protein